MSDTITVTGNIATDPEIRRTPSGIPITSFRIASSQRRFDRATGAWIDESTNWYTVSTFRGLAEHAFRSFKKGHRVLLTGRLRLREWESGAKKGTTAEIDADAIGHDLLWGSTTFERDGGTGSLSPSEGVGDAIETWSLTPAPADPSGAGEMVDDAEPEHARPGEPLASSLQGPF